LRASTVAIAREYNAVIVFEDLEKLKKNNDGNYRLSWMKPLWCYRRMLKFPVNSSIDNNPPSAPRNPIAKPKTMTDIYCVLVLHSSIQKLRANNVIANTMAIKINE
jgi:hypothetical protein